MIKIQIYLILILMIKSIILCHSIQIRGRNPGYVEPEYITHHKNKNQKTNDDHDSPIIDNNLFRFVDAEPLFTGPMAATWPAVAATSPHFPFGGGHWRSDVSTHKLGPSSNPHPNYVENSGTVHPTWLLLSDPRSPPSVGNQPQEFLKPETRFNPLHYKSPQYGKFVTGANQKWFTPGGDGEGGAGIKINGKPHGGDSVFPKGQESVWTKDGQFWNQ